MNKIIDLETALDKLSNGQTVMVGGFASIGTPHKIIAGIVARKIRNLTIISNDAGQADRGIGKLIANKLVKKAILTHIGMNPEAVRQSISGELEVEFNPQGTLAERARCGGAGIPGFYTSTGIGTIVEEGKEIRVFNGKRYLLETALRAEIALIKAYKADTAGNLIFRRSARNFNPIFATAADTVIVEAENIVQKGELDPDQIMLPGIFVDYLVKG